MKKLFTTFFYSAALLVAATTVRAQDPHFSQFFNAPVRQNPALTGVFDGSWRAGFNYRDQWSSVVGSSNAFRTFGLGADMNTFVMKNDFAGLGMYVMRDQAGSGKYTQTNAVLSGSYIKQLSGRRRGWKQAEHYLSGGLQLGFGQNAIDWNTFRFSTQFNGDAFDPNLSNQENTPTDSKTYIDLNAGLLWYAIFNDRLSVHAGGAVNHINQPNIGFFGKNETLYMRYSANLGAEIPLSKQLSILPGAMYWRQGPSQQIEAGFNVRYSNKDWNEVVLRAGVWDRLPGGKNIAISQDALILFGGLDFENWSFGVSYDLNMSELRTVSNSRGGYELSIIYTQKQRRRLGVACPRFK